MRDYPTARPDFYAFSHRWRWGRVLPLPVDRARIWKRLDLAITQGVGKTMPPAEFRLAAEVSMSWRRSRQWIASGARDEDGTATVAPRGGGR